MIEVKDLVKRYNGRLAVDHLSFTVEDNQIYGFLGPGGAGKSTAMNIITGYLEATGGEVIINGHNILSDPEKARLCIGYLPQIPPLYTDMTVSEYLGFSACLKKIPFNEQPEVLEEVLKKAGLHEVAYRLIRNLSKGHRQRVGLAQALLGNPPILILDEPTAGLDRKQSIEMRELILDLKKEHTVLLSSHMLPEVSAVCDHILILAHGKLIASGTPENLERQLAGSHQMNLEIQGDRESAEHILSCFPELYDIQFEGLEDQQYKISFQCLLPDDSGEDIRVRIFWAFAGGQIPILSMTTAKASLEQVFLELTTDEVSPILPLPKENQEHETRPEHYTDVSNL